MATRPITPAAPAAPLQKPARSATIHNLGEHRRAKLMRLMWAGYDHEGRAV